MTAKPTRKANRRPLRWGRIVLGVLLAALVGAGVYHRYTLRLATVEVTGAYFSDPDDLRALARVDTSALLYDLDAALIADRVARHPWVASASATRLPTGTLTLDVAERVPVAVVLDASGRAGHYYDAQGYAMPATGDAFFDVPLLYGAPKPTHATQPVASRSVRELLLALATLTPDEHALVSDVRVEPDGTVTLFTTAAPQGSTLPVLLGRSGFRASFKKLRAFWEQAVLTRPEKVYEHLDLRFSSQIITRES